jgi:hypothetical protein
LYRCDEPQYLSDEPRYLSDEPRYLSEEPQYRGLKPQCPVSYTREREPLITRITQIQKIEERTSNPLFLISQSVQSVVSSPSFSGVSPHIDGKRGTPDSIRSGLSDIPEKENHGLR